MISKTTVYISKIIVCPFTGNGLRLPFSRYHRSRLFGGVCGLMMAVLHTFRDKCSLFQSEYVGCNFGAAVPGK